MNAKTGPTQNEIKPKTSGNDHEHLANQMGGPIHSSSRMLELLRALNAAAASIQKSVFSEKEIYETFSEQVNTLGLRGGLATLDATGDSVTIRAVSMHPKAMRKLSHFEKLFKLKILGYSIPITQVDAYNQVIQTLQPLFVANSSETIAQLLPPFAKPFLGRVISIFGNSPVVYAPLISDTQVIGILNIAGPDINENDIPAIQAFANHIAIALSNLRLYMEAQRETVERQQAEKALVDREKYFRALIEQSTEAIAVIGANGRILYESPAALKLAGMSMEELKGRDVFGFVHPDDHGTSFKLFMQLVQNPGRPVTAQIRYRAPDDTWRWIEATGTNLLRDPTVEGVVVNYRDITARKQAEEALQESEDRYRILAEAAQDMIILLDADGHVQYTNQFAARQFNIPPHELKGKHLTEIFPSEIATRQLANVRSVLKSGEPLYVEAPTSFRDNMTWLGSWLSPVHTRDGRAVLVVSRDITKRKQVEAEIVKLHRAVESSSEAIFLTDLEGTITYINPEFTNLYGYSAGEVIGKTTPRILKSGQMKPEEYAGYWQTLLSKGKIKGEVVNKTKDGRLITIDGTASPILDDNGNSIGYVAIQHDITERKRTEKALRESEDRYRDLVENSQELVCTHDLEGGILSVNPWAAKALGYEVEAILQMNLRDFIVPEKRSGLPLYLNRIRKRGAASGLLHVQTASGERRVWEYNNTLRTEGIAAPIVRGIAHDVTERQQAKQALEESEARYRAVMQKSLEAIYVYDTQLQRMVDVNPAFLSLLGYNEEEAHNLTLHDIVTQDRASVDTLIEKILSEGAIFMGERLWRHKDGTTILMEVTGSRFHQGGKDLVFVIGRDITARKQAEEKIRRQLNYLTALRDVDQIIASTFDIQISLKALVSRATSLLSIDAATILLTDPVTNSFRMAAGQGFRTHKVHTASVKISGSYAGRAILERRMIQIPNLKSDPDNLFRTGFLKDEDFVSYYGIPLIAKGKAIGVMEVFHRTLIQPDQEWFDFLNTLAGQAAIAIDNGLLFENLQRSNLQLEQRVQERTVELNRVNAELEQANRAKDEFLATMSHELRTPLNSILGLSESLLEQRRDPLSEHQQRSLQVIESSGHHLLELINDILDLSKIEAGMFDVYPQAVEVDALCRSSLGFVKSQAMKKSINLKYEADENISTIHADPRRLKQILVNLLTNAVKFTPEHGRVTLQVQADAEQGRVRLTVSDNGIGIAPDDLKRLFQPFVQVDSSLARQQEGTGLGLALIRKLTDLHGGSVHVESEVGKGSRFTINLPWNRQLVEIQKVAATDDARLIKKPPSEGLDEPSEHWTILLAEDNMSNILTIGEYLKSHGYEIVVAHDGWEAIELAEKTDPDLILMDVQMPSLDGLEATRRLRAIPRFASTPIIVLTALAMPGDRERCLEAGATEYMSKPVELKSLRQTIQALLAA